MLDKSLDFSIEEIAFQLCRLAEGCNNQPSGGVLDDTESALYFIKSIAENPYNSDYFRTFWNVLQNIKNYEWED